ncbi:MAG: hypothetical protein H7A46_17425 [Verrucomicrobiales bacterium]|nr:hypothetical protein [Verrucomicrobiales bacterium]
MDPATPPPALPSAGASRQPRDVKPGELPPLREMGQLARGLTLLFWALPFVLVLAVLTARTSMLGQAGFWPALLATGLLVVALQEMRPFRSQDRAWQRASDRARFLALGMTGLTPFLHWWQLAPGHTHYEICGLLFFLGGLLFLLNLAFLLLRAATLLAEPSLEDEARLFLGVNVPLIGAVLALGLAWIGVMRSPLGPRLAATMGPLLMRVGSIGLLLLLVTVALNMTLLWKLKQSILDTAFQTRD